MNGLNDRDDKQSVLLNVTKENIAYGTVRAKISKNVLSLNNAFKASFTFTVHGQPLSFHTVRVLNENSTVYSNTVVLDNDGVGFVHGYYTFYHLNPSCFFTHSSTGGITSNQRRPSRLEGIVEIQNIPYMIEKALDSKWVPL